MITYIKRFLTGLFRGWSKAIRELKAGGGLCTGRNTPVYEYQYTPAQRKALEIIAGLNCLSDEAIEHMLTVAEFEKATDAQGNTHFVIWTGKVSWGASGNMMPARIAWMLPRSKDIRPRWCYSVFYGYETRSYWYTCVSAIPHSERELWEPALPPEVRAVLQKNI